MVLNIQSFFTEKIPSSLKHARVKANPINTTITNSIPSHRIDVIYYEPCSGNETGTFCICYLTSWPFSSPYLAYTRKLDRGSRRRLLSSMAINGWNEIWSHLYWVGRSTNSFPETFTIPFFFFSITS